MDFLRLLDQAALDATSERYAQTLIDSEPGLTNCSVVYTRTEPGGGTPGATMHDHPFDQLFFIVSGTMTIDIEGTASFDAGPNSVVIYPKGVMHRNTNNTAEPTVHLSINLLS
jgi:mannose-6-phosphate isomerase-like protein (cupin superfamily)